MKPQQKTLTLWILVILVMALVAKTISQNRQDSRMLSYSNFGSSSHPMANKVENAVKFLRRSNPNLIVDGPIQSDFALNKLMLTNKFEESKLGNQKVNILVFPNLDSANITYKVIKEIDGAKSIGPIIMGLDKAVHILQLKPSVEEIVNMSAIAVIDAQSRNE